YPGRKIAILVNGCFWHRCPYCNLPLPKDNREFWEKKFADNVERDRRMVEGLEDDGWSVFTVWECQLKKDKVEDTSKTIYAFVSLDEVDDEMPEIDLAPLK
ncbi:MAG: very short patch repair endonuclease, partial [Bacteroidales bacterium]|nr:very short patch repair endonuclease [Bacteroidales bacterium]